MASSWTKLRAEFKSPLRVVAWCLWRSLQRCVGKCRRFKQQRDDARREVARQGVALARQRAQIGELQHRLRTLEAENQRLAAAPCRLPDDPPLESHRYGVRMICLAVNLARVVGLRPSERALEIFWQWLGIEQPRPHWTTIRTWLMRLGVAVLEEPLEEADDRVWMADHSNQIGPEKVLVVLGVRASQLPPPGETVRHEDVRVLAVQPGTRWKREDMAAAYDQLAERYGPPRAVLSDGAVELREGAERLKTRRGDTIVLQDFKHKAAIFLKSLLEKCPRFAERLRATLDATAHGAGSQPLADRLVDFVAEAEAELQPGERLPMSTEILESTFALYKQLEGQHSKGGFTSLLACFAALLQPATEESIRRVFSTVSVKHARQWAKTNLGTTLTAKRHALYAEFRSATQIITAT